MAGLPPLRQVNANDTTIEGYTAPPEGPFENVDYYQNVTPATSRRWGFRSSRGERFSRPTPRRVVVMINQTMARTFYKRSESDRPARAADRGRRREDRRGSRSSAC